MDTNIKNSPCKECNDATDGVQLRAEAEHLRQHLAERDRHIVILEAEYLKSTVRANDLEEQVDTWREKYERLYDSHKRVQKLNQVLEDKLLQLVDKMKSEKSQLTKDIATLSVRLAESKYNYSMLQKENERYKNDMNLAIQLLQCKPDNFVSQKLDNLPVDTQARVSQYVMSRTSKPSGSAQLKNGNDTDTFDASEYEFNISASLMTKILEDSIQDSVTKHCDTCSCTKSQNKPFCYNESYYSVATQTLLSGEMKNPLCLTCNAEIKSIHSNLSVRSSSQHGINLINDKTPNHVVAAPLYVIPQPSVEPNNSDQETAVENIITNYVDNDNVKFEDTMRSELMGHKEAIAKVGEDVRHIRKTSVSMEPAVHHKLCDRTKNSISSKRSSNNSGGNDDILIKDIPNTKDTKSKHENHSADNLSLRKNSHSSMGALSRTSSIAKSTVSTHKSNTQVGPGPRFCHLRMQAGSKNILLDNAEPDVPPVLYRRQSKCNDNSIFKGLPEGLDNFIGLNKTENNAKDDIKNDNVVIESTLIDVHVDNSNKESGICVKTTSINPVLLNVSSSPLQPLKTHNFSNSSEHNNNNKSQSIGSQHNTSEIDNLLNNINPDVNNTQNNQCIKDSNNHDVLTPTDNDVKIFNFDRYEQNKLANQYSRPLRKIDMSQLHSIENTRISKDLPPQGDNMLKLDKKPDVVIKPTLPTVVNVYPNLTQTHLKVNEHKKVFTNEQSTSSLSSDDSAAMLQKQQLLRVAEWVEQNLEQQNNYNDPLEDEVSFNNRVARIDSKLNRLTETFNKLTLNMPHPVSKYSKPTKDAHNNFVHNNYTSPITNQDDAMKNMPSTKVSNIVKETIFPVECGEATVTEINDSADSRDNGNNYDVSKEIRDALESNGDKGITPEDLARMEYNVKKFLLSGPHWVNPGSVGRSRRTSSKTETDV